MKCFHCLGKGKFPPSCIGICHMDLLTFECLVCCGTGEQPPSTEAPTMNIKPQVDELSAYIAELEKDKVRLDFIEKSKLGGQLWCAKVSHTQGFVLLGSKNTNNGFKTVREAIDNEIKLRQSVNK